MDEKNFLDEMMNVLSTKEKISMDTALDGLEDWDSLAYASFLAFASEVTDKKIVRDELASAKTIRDLYELIKV